MSSRIKLLVSLGKELIFSLRLISLQRAYDDVSKHEEILLINSLKRSKNWLNLHDFGGFSQIISLLAELPGSLNQKNTIQYLHAY